MLTKYFLIFDIFDIFFKIKVLNCFDLDFFVDPWESTKDVVFNLQRWWLIRLPLPEKYYLVVIS